MHSRRMTGRGWPGRPVDLRAPVDVVVLLSVLFGTFVLQHFASTAALPAAFRLTPAVWENWQLWRLVSYPFVGFGLPDLWFLLELVILFFFAREVLSRLGRRRFWSVGVGVGALAGVCATLVALALPALAHGFGMPFALMQGQRLLMAVMIAAFGVLAGDAVVYLMFVLPVRAKYFPLIALALAFVAYLASRDLAGFVGIAASIGLTWVAAGRGGTRGALRRMSLQGERWVTKRRLHRLQRERNLRVLDGGKRGPTIH